MNDQQPQRLAGLLAEFDDPRTLVAAAARVRDLGYRRWDCYSPFPVHGIDRAMGIRPTILPWLVLGAGFAGCAVALLMQWWMNAVDYPLVISGKPLFSLPASIPVTFELIVLFSALMVFVGVLGLNQLPEFAHHVFTNRRFARATTDGFFLGIDASDPRFNALSTREFLETLGARSVEECHEPAGRRFPKGLYWIATAAVLIALLPPLAIAKARLTTSTKPRIHPIQDMDAQPRYQTQAAGPLFADGRAMRPAPAGTIAQGELQDNPAFFEGLADGKPVTQFPVPLTEAMMRRGCERFNIYCSTCHGLDGSGDGPTTLRALERGDPGWIKRSLHDEAVRKQPVGQIFQTITRGANTMPSYAAQIPADDRWAIVAYVRALLRSRTAAEP